MQIRAPEERTYAVQAVVFDQLENVWYEVRIWPPTFEAAEDCLACCRSLLKVALLKAAIQFSSAEREHSP